MPSSHLTNNFIQLDWHKLSRSLTRRRRRLEFNLFDRIKCKIQKPIQQIISVCTSPVDLEMHKLNDE